jgi:topoisomerase IV subunit A
MIEKEPITVILSQRGWIRAMKGHVALEEVEQLKWREGDGPFMQFHAQTTDKLALFADNGRVYTLAGDKLPGGRGFGEPVRLQIDLEPEVEIVNLLVAQPGMKLLVASSDGRGFIASGDSTSGRNPQGQAAGQPCARSEGRRRPAGPDGADSIAVVGENRKLLVFPLSDLPELARGQG